MTVGVRSAISYAALVRERERRMPGHAEDDFLAIAKCIRAGGMLPTSHGKPPSDIDAGMEAEMLKSAPIIDDVQKTLESVGAAIEAGDEINLDKVFSLVDEMAAGVERNPDAVIWLTRLMATDRYSYDHAVDVSVHLMVFGRFLGLGRDDVKELGRAGLMQDIGQGSCSFSDSGKGRRLDVGRIPGRPVARCQLTGVAVGTAELPEQPAEVSSRNIMSATTGQAIRDPWREIGSACDRRWPEWSIPIAR